MVNQLAVTFGQFHCPVNYHTVIIIVTIIICLVIPGVIPSFDKSAETSLIIRGAVRGITAMFFLSTAIISFIAYRRSNFDYYYWYCLGLVLLDFGVIFISQGAVASKVAWLGRVAHYLGGIYFLISVISPYALKKAEPTVYQTD